MVIRKIGSLDMNDIKKEDAMRFDEGSNGLVDGVAVIVDGATGFQKDIDDNGNIFSLPDIIEGEHSSARVWADILADEILVQSQNPNSGMVDVLQASIKAATDKMSKRIVVDEFKDFQTPSASVMFARVRGGNLEVLGSGDCCLLMEYQKEANATSVEAITGNEILDNIRSERDKKIRAENPGFDSLSGPEKAKIQFRYMRDTRKSLGTAEGYFVPFYGSETKMNIFLGDMNAGQTNEIRSINRIERGDIWTMTAKAENVKSFMMSSDGFLDKILRNQMATKEDIIKNAKADASYIGNLGQALRIVELGSNADHHAAAMKLAQGKKNTGSADDAVALFFDVSKDAAAAVRERSNTFGMVHHSHYKKR